MLKIDDDYVAFCLDQAIGYFGSAVSHALEEVEGKDQRAVEAGQKVILNSYLYPTGGKGGGFADPAMLFK